ncbi:MAG TPA: ComF family protein [Polyangiaceae bacterium]|jgi:ComF family protein
MPSWNAFGAAALHGLAAIVAPPRCAACDTRVRLAAVFCPACASTLERDPASHSASISAFVYGGAIARALARLKYEQRPDLGRPLGALLAVEVQARGLHLGDAVVVPVPLHVSRLAVRGFNQSALLARPVARLLRIPMFPLGLIRVRDTPQQASLDREARIANVGAAFRARPRAHLEGRSVLLIDDVRTTGATIDACTRALRDGGAAAIVHAVVARA